MPSRLVLRSGAEVLVATDPAAAAVLIQEVEEQGERWLTLGELTCAPDGEPEMREGKVRPGAIDAVLPLSDDETQAYRRERERWME